MLMEFWKFHGKTFPQKVLLVENLKDKSCIFWKFGQKSKLDHFESKRLMMESVRLLQNGFVSLDIIREAEAAAAADVLERKKCLKLRKEWDKC